MVKERTGNMTTIHDIAKKSGYSVSTVSRVLNQRHHVSETARQTILQVIDELDYQPNELARHLSHGKTRQIGVVIPNTIHPFFTEILNGVVNSAFSTPYRIVILPSSYDEQLEDTYLNQLQRKAFDGLIFISRASSLSKLTHYTQYAPVVCCEKPDTDLLSAVYCDRLPAYLQVFNYLKQDFGQAIILLMSRESDGSATSALIVEAYKHVYGCPPKSHQIITGMMDETDGYQVAKAVLAKQNEIQAVFANGDDIASGVLRYYDEQKQIPPLIVGQENQLSSRLLKFSTVDHHAYRIGQEAFRIVTSDNQPEQLEIPSQFIYRE